ncbi:hypothetical protein CPC08DRAFT_696425 [Agrocybe pediades]|nr:hypothetical protein CPC08DRAFT_696425 [Agrocybe pediades]
MASSKRKASEKSPCDYCGEMYAARGMHRHKATCPLRPLPSSSNLSAREEADLQGVQAFLHARSTDREVGDQRSAGTTLLHDDNILRSREERLDGPDIDEPELGIDQTNVSPRTTVDSPLETSEIAATDGSGSNADGQIAADSIRIVTHPNASKPEKVYTFSEFCAAQDEAAQSIETLQDSDGTTNPPKNSAGTSSNVPWRPFRSRQDFELAELSLDTHMNSQQLSRLFDIIWTSMPPPASNQAQVTTPITLHSKLQLDRTWDLARKTRATAFVEHPFSVPYKDRTLDYKVWVRPLWDWCEELLHNTDLSKQFHWDAIRQYKYTKEGQWERFFDEPWTADAWWDFQTSIGAMNINSKPFSIILYADKTRLSSFGTEKGYPVVVRCGNLPVSIRNSEGVGGSRLVGWLPIPEETASDTGKASYRNVKRLIWHEAVAIIFSSIQSYTRFGVSVRCADGISRKIFPFVNMISADYEEQCFMALNRGNKANFPCPVCLVPKDSIPDLSKTFDLRTNKSMEEAYNRSAQGMNATDREELLKSLGIRDVKNMFWSLMGTDIYAALSWDRLHAYNAGLFSDHLLPEMKSIIEDDDVGSHTRTCYVEIDKALDAVPSWPDLNHFNSLKAFGDFADGTKFEDLSKVLVHASVHVLTEEFSKEGFALLRLMRSYLELDMFSSLTLQTESTLQLGQDMLLEFEKRLKEYMKLRPLKQWTFPKAHTHQHMISDIVNKGVTRNYNTKPNEKLNGHLKKFYQNHTNFKNVASQVLRVDEKSLVCTIIRNDIDLLDRRVERAAAEARKRQESESDSEESSDTGSEQGAGPHVSTPSEGNTGTDVTTFEHIECASYEKAITLSELETRSTEYGGLRRKINKHLSTRLRNTARVSLEADHVVRPFRLLKVFFGSVVNWNLENSKIRAHPHFHSKKRSDFALIQATKDHVIFVQILLLFSIKHGGVTYPLALALPYDMRRSQGNRRRDSLLSLTRVRPRSSNDTVIINTKTIIRGALLVEDGGSDSNERLVIESIDEDMWLRMKSVQLAYNVNL